MGRDPQLDSVKIPRGFEWIWSLFWEIHGGASQGMAGASLTWADLEAYGRVTGSPLSEFEAEAVMAMNAALLGNDATS